VRLDGTRQTNKTARNYEKECVVKLIGGEYLHATSNLFINIEFIMFLVIYQLTISRIFKTGCQIKLR